MIPGRGEAELVGDREIAVTRLLAAPRERVFELWTDPEHLTHWWGPRGFRTTTYGMDLRPGGVWRFCMHGPDGRDYQNIVTYLEVEPPARLVYRHGGVEGTEPVNFEVTVKFESVEGKTRLSLRMVFPSAEQRRFVIEQHGAVEGLNEHLSRLEEYLAGRS